MANKSTPTTPRQSLKRTAADPQPLDEARPNKERDPNARQRPSQTGKVTFEDKANPAKPQQVKGHNVNRP